MPARRDYTPDELQQRLGRRRELNREASRRYRARVRMTREDDAARVRMTGAPGTPPRQDDVSPPPTPPVPSSLLFEKRETKKIEHLLSGFAPRGYQHDERFWEKMRERHPRLDLELEVMKLSEWLDAPKNAKRKCGIGFLANWMAKADVDRQQREAQARMAPLPAPTSRAPGKPPDPAPVLPPDAVLEPIDPRGYERHLLEAKRLTFNEKLALAKNGRHG